MSAAFREMLRGHWRHVAQASGLPFSEAIFDREGFAYDTEPACRAVVAAREADAARAHGYFKAVQAAFYRDGRDVTRADVLADIARGSGYDRAAFLARWPSSRTCARRRAGFRDDQDARCHRLPDARPERGRGALPRHLGYVTDDVLGERLAAHRAPRGRARRRDGARGPERAGGSAVWRAPCARRTRPALRRAPRGGRRGGREPALGARAREDFDVDLAGDRPGYAYFEKRRAQWRRLAAARAYGRASAPSRADFIAALEDAIATLHDDTCRSFGAHSGLAAQRPPRPTSGRAGATAPRSSKRCASSAMPMWRGCARGDIVTRMDGVAVEAPRATFSARATHAGRGARLGTAARARRAAHRAPARRDPRSRGPHATPRSSTAPQPRQRRAASSRAAWATSATSDTCA